MFVKPTLHSHHLILFPGLFVLSITRIFCRTPLFLDSNSFVSGNRTRCPITRSANAIYTSVSSRRNLFAPVFSVINIFSYAFSRLLHYHYHYHKLFVINIFSYAFQLFIFIIPLLLLLYCLSLSFHNYFLNFPKFIKAFFAIFSFSGLFSYLGSHRQFARRSAACATFGLKISTSFSRFSR